MMKRFFTLLTALSLCLLATATLAQSNCAPVPASYSVTDLGTLGGVSSFALAINGSGSVAGYGPTAGDTATHPFLWTASAGIQDLGSLGGPLGEGAGINSAGYVVGYSSLPNNILHAFLWTPSGGLQDLGTLGGSIGFSAASAIDDHNRIVGNAYTLTNEDGGDAAIWVGSKIYDLGTNGGFAAIALSVNSKFEVVGFSRNFNPTTTGFFWSKSEGFKTLPSLFTGDGTEALALNNHGWIVGNDTNPTTRAFSAVLWLRGIANNIGSLGGSAAAAGVNDQCQVVGNSILSDNVTYHAFIWTQAGGMQDLNNFIPANSGWILQDAAAINSSGQIAGTGLINGLTHAFLLTPTP
jgi:probable HAF family extracellular repeat protein